MKSNKILAIDTSTENCSVAIKISGNIYSRSEVASNMHSNIILTQIDEVLSDADINLDDLDAFAFVTGPGSFTGLRIGASVIQALAVAGKKPVVTVSSLQTLAQRAYEEKKYDLVLACIDARKSEIYWGLYLFVNESDYFISAVDGQDSAKHTFITPNILNTINIIPDSLSSPDNVSLGTKEELMELVEEKLEQKTKQSNLYVVGNGILNYKDNLIKHHDFLNFDSDILYPDAKYALEIATHKFHQGEYFDAKDAKYAIPTYIRNNIVDKKSN